MSRASRPALILGGLSVLAFALRAQGIVVQSIWLDENFTRNVVSNDLHHMLRGVAATESTPPLFYFLDWAVTQVVGVGDKTLRLVTLGAGTVAVPVAYLLGRRLRDGFAGVVLAALVAVHPLMVWYGVEARSYGLFALLSLLTLLCFVRLLEAPSAARVGYWALSAAAMALTHYFGAFIVGAQVIWLLAARPGARRDVAFALAGLAAVGLAGLTLWAQQDDGRSSFIGTIPLDTRLGEWFHQAAVGMSAPDLPMAGYVWVGALLAVAAAVVWAARDARGETQTLAVGGTTVLAIVLTLLFAKESFFGRNMIGVWPGMAAVVAVGIASVPRRLAVVPALLVGVPALIATTGLLVDSDLQRPDFKGLAQSLGPPRKGQVLVISGDLGALPLGYYMHSEPRLDDVPVPATEIVTVASTRRPNAHACESGAVCNLGSAQPATALQGADLAGLKVVERRRLDYWRIVVYRSKSPVAVTKEVASRFFLLPKGPLRYVRGPPP